MIEHLFCSVNVAGPGVAGSGPGTSPETRAEIDETFSGVAASQLQARPCCVPGGSRPLLAADDLSGWFADPVQLARTQAGPTRPRRQRATGPRTMSGSVLL